jgi:hypothetical protein
VSASMSEITRRPPRRRPGASPASVARGEQRTSIHTVVRDSPGGRYLALSGFNVCALAVGLLERYRAALRVAAAQGAVRGGWWDAARWVRLRRPQVDGGPKPVSV